MAALDERKDELKAEMATNADALPDLEQRKRVSYEHSTVGGEKERERAPANHKRRMLCLTLSKEKVGRSYKAMLMH